MKYNPKIHKRRSIRLKGYDYSQKGLYFITICCQNREHFYGDIKNGIMILNDAGKMIEKWYSELENKFSDIKCREMIVMPNHFHFIIENIGTHVVGADLRVCPNENNVFIDNDNRENDNKTILGEHVGSPLRTIIQWFKTMSTNEYIRGVKTKNWKRFDGKLWQRNYWEHIIRNEKSYNTISDYINNNPINWVDDKFNSNGQLK